MPRALRTLVLQVSRALRAFVPHLPCALRALVIPVLHGLCALNAHMFRSLRAIVPHVLCALLALVSHVRSCFMCFLPYVLIHLMCSCALPAPGTLLPSCVDITFSSRGIPCFTWRFLFHFQLVRFFGKFTTV